MRLPLSLRTALRVGLFIGFGQILSAQPLTFHPDNPPTSPTPPTEQYHHYSGGPHTHQKGPKTLLFVYVRPTDGQTPNVKTMAQFNAEMDNLSQAYYDASYKQTWFGPKRRNGHDVPRLAVTPVVDLDKTVEQYYGNFSLLSNDTISAVRALGGDYAQGQPLDPANFDRIMIFGTPKLIPSTGIAFLGGSVSWSGDRLDSGVAIHELGHNWGVVHANLWIGDDGIPRNASGTHVEYGDGGDVMGGGNTLFNAQMKDQLNFLERSRDEMLTVTSSGTYRLFAHTNRESRRPETNVRALHLPVDGMNRWNRSHILGFRFTNAPDGLSTRNSWDRNAVQIHATGLPGTGSHLIDTTPNSREDDDRIDSAIKIGRTFSEGPNVNGSHIYGGVHITPIARGSESHGGYTHEYIDVVVNYGTFPENQPPVVSFTEEVYAAQVGQQVTFTVNATDPDGDDLAYDWDFGNNTYNLVSAPSQTRTYSSPGIYPVQVAVSDLRGGVTKAAAWVNVGDIPSLSPAPPVSHLAGLSYRYYEGIWTQIPNFATMLPLKTGTVSTVSLAPREQNVNFAFVYDGYINIPDTAIYSFRLTSDDGSRLIINGQTVINNDGLKSSARSASGHIALDAGLHPVRVEFFHRDGFELLQLRWSSLSIPEELVPASAWRRADPADTQVPSVSMISPLPESEVIVGSTVLLQAEASDAAGLDRVQFFTGSTFLGEASAEPWSVNWENIPVGPKSIVALAYNTDGLWSISEPLHFTVVSPEPRPSIGINFNPKNEPHGTLSYNELAGAVYTQPNWHTLGGINQGNTGHHRSNSGTEVMDSLGYPSGVVVSWPSIASNDNHITTFNGADPSTGSGKMFRTFLATRDSDYIKPTVHIDHIPYPEYDLYVYFDLPQNSFADTVPMQFRVYPDSGPSPAPLFGKNSVSTSNGVGDYDAYDTWVGYKEATALSVDAPLDELLGNYVVFRGLTARNISVEADRGNPSVSAHLGLSAIQIVAAPPSSPRLQFTSADQPLVITEGNQALYAVSLSIEPEGPVSVELIPEDGLTLAPASLHFSPANWDQPQPVQVLAPHDGLPTGTRHLHIAHQISGSHPYQGLPDTDFPVQVLDIDQATVNVTRIHDASEVGPSAGRFHVTRSGLTDFSAPLTVSFQMSGSASTSADYTLSGASVDYQPSPGSGTLVIPAGQAQVFLDLMPVQDGLAEGPETAILTLISEPTYLLGEQNTASMTIEDADSSSWFTQHFASGQPQVNFPLAHHTLTLTPDGSPDFYAASLNPASSYPTDISTHLNLEGNYPRSFNTNDGFWTVNDMPPMPFYGNNYNTFHVSTNGNLTFESGSNTWVVSLANHFNLPRISAYFKDLAPLVDGGSVRLGRVTTAGQERTVITWHNALMFNMWGQYNNERVNVQLEVWDNGVITLTWLGMHPDTLTNSLVGLSPGGGEPANFFPTILELLGTSDPGNQPPAILTAPLTIVSLNETYSHTLAAADPENDSLTFTAPQLPAWLSLTDHGNGTATLAGQPSGTGSFPVVVTVSDGELGNSQSFSIQVQPVPGTNTPPTFTSTPATLATSGAMYSHTVTANDPDGGPVQISALQLPSWLTLIDHGDNTATLSGITPTFGVQEYPILLSAQDGSDGVLQYFVLSRNSAPVITALSPHQAVVDLPEPSNILYLDMQVTDDGLPQGSTLTTNWTQLSGPGDALFLDPNSASTEVSFPGPGAYRLLLTASDGTAESTRDVQVFVGEASAEDLRQNGLAGYWPFDGPANLEPADLSGNNITGSLIINGEASFSPGQSGLALRTAANVPNTTRRAEVNLGLQTNFSVSLWFTAEEVPPPARRYLFTWGRHATSSEQRWQVRMNEQSRRLRIYANRSTTSGVWEIERDLPAGEWVHLVITAQNHNPVGAWINGDLVPISTITEPVGAQNTDSNILRIGGHRNENQHSWNGLIDDFRVYQRVVPENEITLLAVPGPTHVAPSLIAGETQVTLPGQSIPLQVEVNAPEPSAISLQWTQQEGPGEGLFAGASMAETNFTTSGNPGVYRLRLTADDGLVRVAAESEVVAEPPLINEEDLPVVTILTPAPDSRIYAGETVIFSGTAVDKDDHDISATAQWISSLDGLLGEGASLSIDTLSVGHHTISYSATDADSNNRIEQTELEIVPLPWADPVQPENTGGGTGAIYYLDATQGSDSNSGLSETQSWQTFQHAIDSLQPGDTVLIREGDYFSSGNPEFYNWNITTSGTPLQFITYRAYPGERPRFHVDTWNGIQLWEVAYIEIDGLEIIGLPDPEGLAAEPDNSPARQALAEDRHYFGGGITVTHGGIEPHHLRIRNNLVHQVGGNGIGFRGGNMILVEGNTVHSSTHRSSAGNSAISFVELNSAIHPSSQYGVVVRKNTLHHNRNRVAFHAVGYITDGNGVIIDYCQDYTDDRILLANNLAHHNGGRAFHIYNGRNVDVIHNTAYHNLSSDDVQWSGELSSDAPNGETNQSINFHNNIAVARADRRAYHIANTTDWDFTHNLANSPRTPAHSVDGYNLLNIDPIFADVDAFDFRVMEDSPVIDEGLVFALLLTDLEGNDRNQGDGPDLGAFEGGVPYAPNHPPAITILSPSHPSTYVIGATVTLTASADDPEDGDLSAEIIWSSSIDGHLGTGGSLNVTTLSLGTHTLTASVADSGGLTDSDSVSVTIEEPPPPLQTLARYTFENVPALGNQHSSGTFIREASPTEAHPEISVSNFFIRNHAGSAARLIATDAANNIAGAAQIAGIESNLFQWQAGGSTNPYFEFTLEGAGALDHLRIVARSGSQWNNAGAFLSYDANRRAEISVRTSLDNFAENVHPVFVAGNQGSFVEELIDLSSLTVDGQAVTFRIYTRSPNETDPWHRTQVDLIEVTGFLPGIPGDPYEQWAEENNITGGPGDLTNGMANLLRYALGGTANSSWSELQPIAEKAHLRLQLSFHRISDPNLTYQVWASSDLVNWGNDPIWSSSGNDNLAGEIVVEDVLLTTEQPRRFLRLVILRE